MTLLLMLTCLIAYAIFFALLKILDIILVFPEKVSHTFYFLGLQLADHDIMWIVQQNCEGSLEYNLCWYAYLWSVVTMLLIAGLVCGFCMWREVRALMESILSCTMEVACPFRTWHIYAFRNFMGTFSWKEYHINTLFLLLFYINFSFPCYIGVNYCENYQGIKLLDILFYKDDSIDDVDRRINYNNNVEFLI